MIDVIYPEIFKPLPGIQGFFTLSNRHLMAEGSEIKGLNLGINTSDSMTVVDNNRHTLAQSFDIDPESFAIAEQIHGDHIQVVDQPGLYKKTDGLITSRSRLTLAIQAADCAAVMIADVANNTIGVFHAGWRGAVHHIITKGLNMIKVLGNYPPQFIAYISPCISQKSFEVGTEVSDQFPAAFVDKETYEKPHINLKEYLKNELMNGGVKEENIEVSNLCTVENPEFYSYRRERGEAGRMLACLYLKNKK